MSTCELVKRDGNTENEDEYAEDCSNSEIAYRKLKVENEKYRQEVYALRRKLELNETMLREVQEANESIEHSFCQQIKEKEKLLLDVEDRYRASSKEYQAVITNLETKLKEQTIKTEKLQELLDQRKETETAISFDQSAVNYAEANDRNIAVLENRIEELTALVRDGEKKREHTEITLNELTERCEHYERASRLANEQLIEKDQVLENVREELAMARMEMMSNEIDPARDQNKGNSLFAEVEDRRRNALDKMTNLREKYAEAKRVCKAQATEIKILRSERAALFKKWENDTVDTLMENDEIINKYKSRISELENKLKTETKKNVDSNEQRLPDHSFGYLQSLLTLKKKEVEELKTKVEDLTTRLLMQEETKLDLNRQLRHWQYKATSFEARILYMNTESATHSESTEEAKRKELLVNHTDDASHDNAIPSEVINRLDQPDGNVASVLSNINSTKKVLRFMEPVKDKENNKLEKHNKEKKYPLIYIPTDHD